MNNNNGEVQKTNTIAITGFVLSFFIAIFGLILSIVGLKKSKELNNGRGFSIAGIIISSLLLITKVIVILFIIILFNYKNTIGNKIITSAKCSKAYNCYNTTGDNYKCKYIDDDTNFVCTENDLKNTITIAFAESTISSYFNDRDDDKTYSYNYIGGYKDANNNEYYVFDVKTLVGGDHLSTIGYYAFSKVTRNIGFVMNDDFLSTKQIVVEPSVIND